MTHTITGKGVFSWDAAERRSDRYGAFVLDTVDYDKTAYSHDAGWSADPTTFDGMPCTITVTVLENRESGHIGDFFRGISPTKPDVGEVIDLGTGELFTEIKNWGVGHVAVGLVPDDDRESDWFDPNKLYRLHDQTVQVVITVVQE
jgi:hypothetical protein